MRAGRIRKLVPSVPSTLKPNPQVPEAVRNMAAGCTDPALLQLQSSFLEMYSASQQSVSLPSSVVNVKAMTRGKRGGGVAIYRYITWQRRHLDQEGPLSGTWDARLGLRVGSSMHQMSSTPLS